MNYYRLIDIRNFKKQNNLKFIHANNRLNRIINEKLLQMQY